LIAFLFAGNPLVVGWLASNVGGQSKKVSFVLLPLGLFILSSETHPSSFSDLQSTLVAMYQVGSSVGVSRVFPNFGLDHIASLDLELTPSPSPLPPSVLPQNIVGPLLFSTDQAPRYKKGLSAVLGLFVAVVGIVVLMAFMFLFLNKKKEAERVRNGKREYTPSCLLFLLPILPESSSNFSTRVSTKLTPSPPEIVRSLLQPLKSTIDPWTQSTELTTPTTTTRLLGRELLWEETRSRVSRVVSFVLLPLSSSVADSPTSFPSPTDISDFKNDEFVYLI